MRRFSRILSISLLCLAGVTRSSAVHGEGELNVEIGPLGPGPGFAPRAHEPSEHEHERRACEQKVRAVLQQPALPGTPQLDANREEILFETKAEPVLFVRAPQYVDVEPPHDGVISYRKWLASSEFPWDVLSQLRDHFTIMPANGRAILLKDGYLYADTPRLARALVTQVSTQHLFGHDHIWIQRGEETYHAARRKGSYYYTDGPNEGDAVRLLLFDRVGPDEGVAPSPPLHRDLRSLRYRLHFTRMQVRHLTETHIVALLKYNDRWVTSLLKSEGARLDLECEITDVGTQALVNAEREEIGRRQRAVQVLRGAMLQEIAERLPFDEPHHEFGHQFDGVLRRNWRSAYFSGRRHYNFTGDRYDVFDLEGRPLVPQVCVDFLTDTFERASGTWYRGKGQPPGKTTGALDFGTEIEKPWLRRAPDFVNYAGEHGEWFDVLNLGPDDQIPMGQREALRSFLVGRARDFLPGDVLIIKGYTPWDPRTMHYHSFFLYESDPLSGLPIALVGNTGRPTMRVWEREAKRTPKRAILHRLRPRIEWMEQIFAASLASVNDKPATLTPRGAVD